MSRPPTIDLSGVTTVLCDADGTLFPSEAPAFAASAVVSRQLAERYGLAGDFSPEALRAASTGRNFRDTTASRLAQAGIGVDPDELDEWVRREKEAVTERLAEELVADAAVLQVVKGWAQRYRLAVVSSSAMSRLDACFTATGLDEYFPKALRFSAEDSLRRPVSKPDPAVYLHALDQLGCSAAEALAIEDSVSGTQAAVAAGVATIAIVQFAPEPEQAALREHLLAAGATAVATTWADLEEWL